MHTAAVAIEMLNSEISRLRREREGEGERERGREADREMLNSEIARLHMSLTFAEQEIKVMIYV